MPHTRLRRALLLAGWIAVAAPTCTAGGPDLSRVRDLLSEGRIQEAERALDPLAADRLDARLLLTEIHRRTGRYEQALALLEDSAQPAAVLARADILLATGAPDKARELLAPLQPSPEKHYLLGAAYAARGNTAAARAAWEAAIPLYEAMTTEEALAGSPERFVIFGRVLVGLNRFQEANEVMLAQAFERDRDNLAALLFAGEIFTAKYDFPEARRFLRKARDVSRRHPDVLALLAQATLADPMMGGDRLAQARALVEEALGVNPRHPRAHIIRGDLDFFDGFFDDAAASYRAALDADAASLEALGAMYTCAVLTFQHDEAQRIEGRAKAVSAGPAAFYHAAAVRCDVQCLYPLGLSLSEQAQAADPSYWPLYTTLALGQLRAGRYEQAAASVKEGFARDRYNVWLNNTRQLLAHMDRAYTTTAWRHLVFHAPRETAPFFVEYLGPLLAEAWSAFENRYGTAPPAPVHIEVYPRQDLFACRVLGLPDFPAQGVCFGRVIAITVPPALAGNHAISAWHEFAHAFTVTGSGFRIPRWLTEAISVREEGLCPVGGTRSWWAALGRSLARDDLPAFSDFDRRFRRPRDMGELLAAYALSPLAVELLIERFGHGTLQRIIRGVRDAPFEQVFEESTGKALAAFDEEFRAHLRALGADAALQFAGEGVDVRAAQARVKAGAATSREKADLAWALLDLDNDTDAETMALMLREDQRYAGDAAAVLGLVHFARGRTADARRLLQEAIEKRTRNAFRVHVRLAHLAQTQRDAEAQLSHLLEAWRRFPDLAAEGADHGVLGALCQTLAARKDPRLEEALEDLVARSREAAWGRRTLAALHADKGAWERAAVLLRELVYIAPFDRAGAIDRELFEQLADYADKAGLTVEAARARRVLAAGGG